MFNMLIILLYYIYVQHVNNITIMNVKHVNNTTRLNVKYVNIILLQ